jgi:hypothetical protein
MTLTDDQLNKIVELISEALYDEAAWHKQWYLEQIAEVLDIDLTIDGEYDFERGIAP